MYLCLNVFARTRWEAFSGCCGGTRETRMKRYKRQPEYRQVVCIFKLGGLTGPMRRTTDPLYPTSWDQAKAGFGDVSQVKFFIGLEKVHQLTRQANYNLNIVVQYNNWNDVGNSLYDNFTVGKCKGRVKLNCSQNEGEAEK